MGEVMSVKMGVKGAVGEGEGWVSGRAEGRRGA